MPSLDNLALMPRREWEAYLEGYGAGYVHGIDRGRQLGDDEAATLHREAVRIVHAMAKLDPWDDVQARRRQRQVEAADRHAGEARPWPEEAS